MNHWRITYNTEDRSTGEAVSAYMVIAAPTAQDAITMFGYNVRNASQRYFHGPESIEWVSDEAAARSVSVGKMLVGHPCPVCTQTVVSIDHRCHVPGS